MFKQLLRLLSVAAAAQAHMSMFYPPPLGGAPSINKQSTTTDKQFNYPLGCCGGGGGDSKPSPGLCRGHLDKFDTEQASVTWQAGQDAHFQLTDYSYDPNAPGSTHSGGSCQVGFSTDKGATWKVAASYHGSCPKHTTDGSPDAQTFDFKVPTGMPDGDALFAWIWLNREHEAFMNCAKVKITGGSGAASPAPSQSPAQPNYPAQSPAQSPAQPPAKSPAAAPLQPAKPSPPAAAQSPTTPKQPSSPSSPSDDEDDDKGNDGGNDKGNYGGNHKGSNTGSDKGSNSGGNKDDDSGNEDDDNDSDSPAPSPPTQANPPKSPRPSGYPPHRRPHYPVPSGSTPYGSFPSGSVPSGTSRPRPTPSPSNDGGDDDNDVKGTEDKSWWARPHKDINPQARKYTVDNMSCTCRPDPSTSRCFCNSEDSTLEQRAATEKKALRMHRRALNKRATACAWSSAPAMQVSYFTPDAKCAPNAKVNMPTSDKFELSWDVNCGVVEGDGTYPIKQFSCSMYG